MTKELVDIPDIEVKKVKSILTQEDVKELFEYRDGDLYWKIDIFAAKHKSMHKVKIGDKAGCIANNKRRNKQYKAVCYGGKIYKISRLIFLMYNGYLAEKIIYKDGDTLNTKIENLLGANSSQTLFRANKYSSNKSGYKGVCFDKKFNKYRADIGKNNTHVFLGSYNTAEEASRAYNIAKEKYHGEFISKCNN